MISSEIDRFNTFYRQNTNSQLTDDRPKRVSQFMDDPIKQKSNKDQDSTVSKRKLRIILK